MTKLVNLVLQIVIDILFGLAANWVLSLTPLNAAWVTVITLGVTAFFAECLELKIKH